MTNYPSCLLPVVVLLKLKWLVAIARNALGDVAPEPLEGVAHLRSWEVKMTWKMTVTSTMSLGSLSSKQGQGGSTMRGVIKTILKASRM
jgi:hypothetical protein